MPRNILYRGDQNPALAAIIRDGLGNPVDLTGTTVQLALRLTYDPANAFKASADPDPDQVNNKGKVVYTIGVNDLTQPLGIYSGQWVVTKSSKPEHFSAGEFELREGF